MFNFKLAFVIAVVTLLLTVGQPNISKADSENISDLPPAVTFIQDSENKMLVEHNFVFDNGMLTPAGEADVDPGFYVVIPVIK